MRCCKTRFHRNDDTTNDSVTITYSPADIVFVDSNTTDSTADSAIATYSPVDMVFEKSSEEKEVEEMAKEKKNLGVVPSNPKGYGKSTDPWEAPTLGDFTNKRWGELTDAEKRKIASCFAWSPQMPPERFTDLKLPHHNPKTKNVVWRGVTAAMAALFGARGGVDIPEADRKKVYNHLAKHYEDFEKEPPSYESALRGDFMTDEEINEEENVEEEEKKADETEELKKKLEEYELIISECRKAREELQAKYEELRAEFEKIEEEKKRLEEMRGKPKVENKQTEEKDAEMSEYERLRKLIKSI